jgi:hypothetical protein
MNTNRLLKSLRWPLSLTLVVGTCTFTVPHPLRAAEVGDSSRYYEDDGWLDITEWLDGNDYNPTDEAWWRWDDEQYQATRDNSGDRDSDWYGYTDRQGGTDWFYDYYDPYAYSYYGDTSDNAIDIDRYGVHYYDYDRDGAYDAFMTFTDRNDDGLYDKYNYVSFSDDAGDQKQQQQAKQQTPRESRHQSVTGKIENTKQVQVRGGDKHLVVQIKPQQQQEQGPKSIVADLGNADELKDLNLVKGANITVSGPRAKVGQQAVLLAKSVKANDLTRQIDRPGRQLQGKVLSTHKATVRGTEHLMAIVDATRQGSDKSAKVAVDLGPADKLKVDVKEGASLTFTGMPVKVKDKRLVIAQSVKDGDQFVQINRQPAQPPEAQPAASRSQGQSSTPNSDSNSPEQEQEQEQNQKQQSNQ